MNKKSTSLQSKKNLAVVLHIVFLLVALSGISMMYMNDNFGNGLGWLTQESYEDTNIFSNRLRDDIDRIFEYVRYKDIFETKGMVDYNKPLIQVNDGPHEEDLTLGDMVRYAKSLGYILDENYEISGTPADPPEEEADEYMVSWRAYEPELQYDEPGEAYYTKEELALEVLACLGSYYSNRDLFFEEPANLHFRIVYNSLDGAQTVYSNLTEDLEVEEVEALGKYIFVSGDSIVAESNINNCPENAMTLLESFNPYKDSSDYYMVVAVDTAYPAEDAFLKESIHYQNMRRLFILGLILMLTGMAGCIITMYYLLIVSGHKYGDSEQIFLHHFDLVIPTELWVFASIMATFFALYLGEKFCYRFIHLVLERNDWYYGENLLRSFLIYLGIIIGVFGMLRRYKGRTLWSNSIAKLLSDSCRIYFRKQTFSVRLVTGFSLYLMTTAILLILSSYLYFRIGYGSYTTAAGVLALLWVVMNLWVFHRLYLLAIQKDRINEGVHKIAGGDTGFKIDTSVFRGKEKDLAENINNISTGLNAALVEQVRSERMKADLITNVSHDIKTPLTSIINYVDLIKREHLDNPRVQEYLDVLEQKSQRLKNLTEDLVEASKASSGNIKLELADIDLVELIQQTNGEFEEKFGNRHLELVPRYPSFPILVEADGRHLWRVLENLYNNAFKYSMPHSRVYITVEQQQDEVSFTIKNVSENPLNINAAELTERFVRGDVARTTEGSGLGLSIAKSLTELQKGRFELFIDGDLFKAQVTFPVKQLQD